mmetsp:Transcript_19017/g.39114  ORF Transcript_19017/g.39114 Transcript_19017/m.39114 type:complete len:90 (-) Transcript_19017:290-559(-)
MTKLTTPPPPLSSCPSSCPGWVYQSSEVLEWRRLSYAWKGTKHGYTTTRTRTTTGTANSTKGAGDGGFVVVLVVVAAAAAIFAVIDWPR